MTEPINILIVDDEPRNLTVLETVLADPGYRLVRAESAEQALLALVVEEFALLILDIRMPGMTGFELAQMIKERKKTARVPIIFLTAYYNDDLHMLEGYGTGAVDYLPKPVNAAILRSKVAVFAELRRTQREVTMANRTLLAEVTERCRAEERLRELNETLEQRVAERTVDLTQANAALQKSESLLRSITDSTEDIIFVKDIHSHTLFKNPAGLRANALPPERVIGRSDVEFNMDKGQAVQFLANDRRVMESGRTETFEEVLTSATGETRLLLTTKTPLFDAGGQVIGLVGVAHDFTERKRAEEALKASLHEKEVLLREVHHRVKNNLQIVSSLLNLQSRQITDPAMLDVFASTRDRVRAMASVHEQLYENDNFAEISLPMQIGSLTRMLTRAHATGGAGIQPVLQLDPVTVDLNTAVPLSLIASELITNALKYAFAGRPDGKLAIGLHADGEWHELSVADDGPGLPADLDPATSRTLGLRLVRDLARQIRGELEMKSTASGTCITVRWPARPAAEEPLMPFNKTEPVKL